MKYKSLAYLLFPLALLVNTSNVNAQKAIPSDYTLYADAKKDNKGNPVIKNDLQKYQLIVNKSGDICPIDYVNIMVSDGKDTLLYNTGWSAVGQFYAKPGQKLIITPTKESSESFKPLEYILKKDVTQIVNVE